MHTNHVLITRVDPSYRNHTTKSINQETCATVIMDKRKGINADINADSDAPLARCVCELDSLNAKIEFISICSFITKHCKQHCLRELRGINEDEENKSRDSVLNAKIVREPHQMRLQTECDTSCCSVTTK